MAEPPFKHIICPLVVLKLTDVQVKGDDLADELRDELLAVATQTGAVYVILDFQAVTFVTSAGVRPLLSLNRSLHDRGGRLVLCNLSAFIRESFAATRLISSHGTESVTFESQPDVPAAVAFLYQGS